MESPSARRLFANMVSHAKVCRRPRLRSRRLSRGGIRDGLEKSRRGARNKMAIASTRWRFAKVLTGSLRPPTIACAHAHAPTLRILSEQEHEYDYEYK